jgi:hypothetical protein
MKDLFEYQQQNEFEKIINSFKEKNREFSDKFWLARMCNRYWSAIYRSEDYPDYDIIWINKPGYFQCPFELFRQGESIYKEYDKNKLIRLAEVIKKDLQDGQIKCYCLENDEIVEFTPPPPPQFCLTTKEIEHYTAHPQEIAKEFFCYAANTNLNRELLSYKISEVSKQLKQRERKEWQAKAHSLYPCDKDDCPYQWCCIRHEVKTKRIYDYKRFMV